MVIFILAGGLFVFSFLSVSEANSPAKPEEGTDLIRPSGKGIKDQGKSKAISVAQPLTYKPPLRGTPGGRIGGGTRGDAEGSLVLNVLAPDHTGLTTSTQPILYWYLSRETSKQIEFTLNIEHEGKTVAQEAINAGPSAGIKPISLKDIGVELAPGKEYTWFIAMSVDPAQPSRDIFSGGVIRLVEPSETLREKLTAARKEQLPAIYADEGIWYDALAAISAMIDEDPRNVDLQEQRAQLLDQVGLHHAAGFDREKRAIPSPSRQ